MEATQGSWIETLDDGTLYFKDVSHSYNELKEKNKDAVEYEHTEENCILNLKSETDFDVGKKYLHTTLNKFVTISDVERDENDKVVKYTVSQEDSDVVIELTSEETSLLLTKVGINIRVFSKSGVKHTIEGFVLINSPSFMKGVKDLLDLSGINSSKYKILKKKKDKNDKVEVPQDTSLASIYETGVGVNLFALESLGKPSKWKRFISHYEGSSWSSSGSSADGLVFIPKKDILLAGFWAWAPKDDPFYFMKYKVEIDGRTVEEDNNPTNYTKFVDTYYNPIMFENPHEVKANQKIKLSTWMSKDFSSTSYTYTYYGTNGSDYGAVVNEHMGLFELEASDNSGNGTSIYSGHFPEIYYHL